MIYKISIISERYMLMLGILLLSFCFALDVCRTGAFVLVFSLTSAGLERMKHVKVFGGRLQLVKVFGGRLQRPSPFFIRGHSDVNADGW